MSQTFDIRDVPAKQLDFWRLLHRLWTKAAVSPGYLEEEWRELEQRLKQNQQPPSGGPMAFEIEELKRRVEILEKWKQKQEEETEA